MKLTAPMTIQLMMLSLLLSAPAFAFEGRTAYESGDGHWIYFGPAPTEPWTASRVMPAKRSLEGSVRHDALRHYAMPRYELPESGEVIAFGKSDDATAPAASVRRPRPDSTDKRWEVFELPESGGTIRFAREVPHRPADETVVARHGDSTVR